MTHFIVWRSPGRICGLSTFSQKCWGVLNNRAIVFRETNCASHWIERLSNFFGCKGKECYIWPPCREVGPPDTPKYKYSNPNVISVCCGEVAP